ncbi:MAG: type II secretion system minor pseudopilin GspH [Pseudomonas protegens]|uniref:type II secretion system minor pseudopilin GspH n=1 Tax=Pseudomonas protegens TaxID=380021 RepID=UPI00383A2F30
MQRRHARGFTLLELLVVILLIALTAGLVGLVNPDSGPRQARQEAQRLQALLQLLRQEAVLSYNDYGLRIEPDGYSVLRLDARGRWVADPELRPHRLPDKLRLRLEVAEAGAPLGSGRQRDGLPQLLVLSSDETSAYTLWVEYRNQPLVSLSSDGIQDAQLDTQD